MHALRLDPRRVTHRDLPVRVAAVDDDVARVAELGELIDRFGRRVARGNHYPHHTRLRLEGIDELLHRQRGDCSLRCLLLDRIRGTVVRDHAVAALHEAQDHVAAHAAQSDHPHLHCRSPLSFPSTLRGEGYGVGREHPYLTEDLTAAASAFQPVAVSLPSVTRTTGRRRDVSDSRSPSDCACLRIEKLNGWPGIGTSRASS